MRVSILSLHYAEYCLGLASALANRAKVQLFLYEGNAENELGEHWQALVPPGVELVVLRKPAGALGILKNTWACCSALARFRPDVVHMQEGGERDETVLASLLHRQRLVLTIHDLKPHVGGDATALARSRLGVYQAINRRLARAYVCHGRQMAEDARTMDFARNKSVAKIHHGPLYAEKRPAQLTADIEKGVLLFFGRIQLYKGLGDFIKLVRRLHEEGVPVKGVVAGRGPDLQPYQDELRGSPLFSLLDRYISRDEVGRLFSQANVVLLPYIEGTQSGVAAIAIGMGRPVVATDVGAIPEMVMDGFNGYVVPPGAIGDMAEAVKKLILDEALTASMCENALRLEQGTFSWRQAAELSLELYGSVFPRSLRERLS